MRFDRIDVLLLEPNPLLRRAIRDALASMGVTNITALSVASELSSELHRTAPDLVICDGVAADSTTVQLTRSIRHGFFGENPFVTILTTAESPSLALVRDVINSGTDNLVRKPFCMQDVIDRVQAAVDARKPFVVTKDYIGPCRRHADRQDQSYPLIEVPNTVRDKVTGLYDREQSLEDIRKARSIVDEQKTSRNAQFISAIAIQIARAAKDANTAHLGPILPHVEHLDLAAGDMRKRLAKSGESEVAALCDSLLTVVQKIRADNHAPDHKDIELLQGLAHAIFMAYQPDSRIAKYAENISTAIKGAKRYQVA